MREARGGGLTLAGPPGKAAGLVADETIEERVVPVSLSVLGEPCIYRAAVRPYGRGQSQIRLRLPADTPPGRYNGESTIGGKRQAIVVEVEPVRRIRVQPAESHVPVGVGATGGFEITVSNVGNVVFDVPKVEMIDIDDADGQERALGRALRARVSPNEKLVDRLFEELRASHGGEAKVTVLRGAGPLNPGESRLLACQVDAPQSMRRGVTYTGTWPLGRAAHTLLMSMAAGEPDNGGRVRG